MEEFFSLLANRKFPCATFIRTPEDLDYIQEPDIFHELFGHCPLLAYQPYADFSQKYGEIALKATPEQRLFLGRLYWFTVEFGLIKTDAGNRIYGGGILSSKEETIYSLESTIPERRAFGNGLDALRTPYRIDMLQTIYYVIESFDCLYKLLENDILGLITEAQSLGEFEPTFPPVDGGPEMQC